MYSRHYTTSINCCEISNCGFQNLLHCIFSNVYIDNTVGFGLEQENGSFITPIALAHHLHPIISRSRNKRRYLWVESFVSSRWFWFWSVYTLHSIYYYIHIKYYICSLIDWNELFLGLLFRWYVNDIVILSWFVSNLCFDRIVQYSLHYYIDMDVTLGISQLHPIVVYRTDFFGCTLFCGWMSLSFY